MADYDYDHLEPISYIYGISGVSLSVLFFYGLNKLIVSALDLDEKSKTSWKIKNLYGSWIHAFTISIWVVSIFALYEEVHIDLIAYHNLNIYLMVTYSTGYFCVDMADHMAGGVFWTHWEVMVHHICVLSIFVYNLTMCRYLPFTGAALLVEINSIFLHARKIFQLLKVDYNSRSYVINKWVNLVTFTVFRFGALVWITWAIVKYPYRFSLVYGLILRTVMFVMWIINTVLFWRLLKSDVLRNFNKKSPQKSLHIYTNGTNNNNVNHCLDGHKNGYVCNWKDSVMKKHED